MCDGLVEELDVSASRAVLAPPGVSNARNGSCPKPLAAFLTQLLACRIGEPAYRSRRRAEPDFASAAYGAECDSAARTRLDRML
jgi:hypothetical protein